VPTCSHGTPRAPVAARAGVRVAQAAVRVARVAPVKGTAVTATEVLVVDTAGRALVGVAGTAGNWWAIPAPRTPASLGAGRAVGSPAALAA
jgi:hypothetical protein